MFHRHISTSVVLKGFQTNFETSFDTCQFKKCVHFWKNNSMSYQRSKQTWAGWILQRDFLQMIQGRVSFTSKTRNLRRFSSVHFWMARKFTVSKFKWLFWSFKSFKRLWIYGSHIFEVRLNWELGTNSDQLLVGLLAQLVERCTSIAKIMGSNPVQAWNFFRPSFHYCLSSVHYREDRFHIAKVC